MSFRYDPDHWGNTASSDTPELSSSMASPSATAAATAETAAAAAADLHIASADGKRQRVSRACDRCRRKKVKCDGKQPVCTHCSAIGVKCTYLDATKKRGPPKGYIEVIENRLRKVEELLCSLITTDSNAARHVLDDLRSADGSEAAIVSDSSGKLFGMLTMSELESRANTAPQRTPRNSLSQTTPCSLHSAKAPATEAAAPAANVAAGAPCQLPRTSSTIFKDADQYYAIEPSVAAAAEAAEARRKRNHGCAGSTDDADDSYAD
ncbi:hypothetical protein LPJ56_004805, partial [Coemansia sp. RSA 2599]